MVAALLLVVMEGGSEGGKGGEEEGREGLRGQGRCVEAGERSACL
jgi:hypothetical protein